MCLVHGGLARVGGGEDRCAVFRGLREGLAEQLKR
jgi:hypothetical protein